MRVHEDKARALLLALGYDNAMKYGPRVVAGRLGRVEADVSDAVRMKVKDAGLKRLMNTVIKAVKAGDRVELIDPAEVQRNKTVETFGKKLEREANRDDEKEDEAVSMARSKVGSVGRADPPKPDSEGDIEDGSRDAKEVRQVTAPPGLGRAKELSLKHAQEAARREAAEDDEKIRPKRTSKHEWPDLALTERTPPGHGTIQREIFNVLSEASEDEPLSKDQVVEYLEKWFPDKPKKNLKWNVDGFPHWLPRCFPFSVNQKNKRYWLLPRYDE